MHYILTLILIPALLAGTEPALAKTRKQSKDTPVAAPTQAQEPVTPPAPVGLETEEEESYPRMMWRDFISPVTTPAWIALAGGSAFTMLVFNTRGTFENPLQENWRYSRPIGDTGAHLGDVIGQLIPNLAYMGGMYADYYWGSKNKKSRERAVLMFRATTYAGLVATGLKYTVHEHRPNGSDRKSFPSGHATTTFAFAAAVGAEHEWYWGLGAYTLASYVGLSRIASNMHRLHDVLAGATIGMSYGLGIYYRMHEHDPKPLNTVYNVLPTDDMQGGILTVTHTF